MSEFDSLGSVNKMFDATMQPRLQVTKQPTNRETNHATTVASNQATVKPAKVERTKRTSVDAMVDTLVETIRSSIKEVGKETTSYRLHETEKGRLQDMLYLLKKEGFKTSENELMRIGLNYLFNDFDLHKNDSLAVKVLEALKA